MPKRLKVLISAYSCEPGKGSEPEVGWQWALQMARFHEVYVLTRANNRELIEPELEKLQGKQPLPKFIYHDRGPAILEAKKRFNAVKIYYLLWQKQARDVIQRLNEIHQFDLMHHVTFAGFRYPIAIWGHGAPCIWGPIGGIESIPRSLLPWHHLASLWYEVLRNANNLLQATPFHVLPKRAKASTLILASTPEMKQVFSRLGFETELMPTIGLKTGELPYREKTASTGPLRLLFVGNIITLKGVDLALEALNRSGTDATFTLFGTGNYLSTAQKVVKRLGLEQGVQFMGRRPRAEILTIYPDYDVLLFPSLHDTGGYAVIEAMFNGLPVICLDCGGPAVAVTENSGQKIPLASRGKVIVRLSQAIRYYSENRQAVAEHGRAARESILKGYDWNRKGEQMNSRYEMAVEKFKVARTSGRSSYSGMGAVTNLLNRMFSFRGVMATLIILLMIGALGFISVGHLKSQARLIVRDTLPGLSYAGEANTSLAQAYNRTLLLLIAEDPARRADLRKEVEAYSQKTTQILASYKNQTFAKEDADLFHAWIEARKDYLGIREKVLNLAESKDRQAALELFQRELLPAYERYKGAGDGIFRYNMRQGQDRGYRILKVCTATQFMVALISIVIFAVGFFFGMFK